MREFVICSRRFNVTLRLGYGSRFAAHFLQRKRFVLLIITWIPTPGAERKMDGEVGGEVGSVNAVSSCYNTRTFP